jgi:hypothetical protein
LQLAELRAAKRAVTHCVGDLRQAGVDATDRGSANVNQQIVLTSR